MLIQSSDPKLRWPSAEELPDSDDTPVDSELQNHIPNLADDVLSEIWGERQDWFWGVDMGIYYHPHRPPLIPDGFLSIGVQRLKATGPRPSYVLWEEDWIIPILVLEVVSKTYGGEYDIKMENYAELGVLYYVVYNPFYRPPQSNQKPRRGRYNQHLPLEVYRLEAGRYVLQPGNPVWLPEIQLGIGCEVGYYKGQTREWVYWYNQEGHRYLTSHELKERAQQQAAQEWQRAELAQQQAAQERQRAERLAEYLRSQGLDPDHLP